MIKFIGKIKLGPNDIGGNEVSFTTDKDEYTLVYDEVEFELIDKMEKIFPLDDFPKAEICEIFISKKDDNSNDCLYPVVSEHESKNNTPKFQKYCETFDKILILPDAVYSLTPEAHLYYSLINEGLISENKEFDFVKMNKIITSISNKLKTDN
jgi:hypothetical protein